MGRETSATSSKDPQATELRGDEDVTEDGCEEDDGEPAMQESPGTQQGAQLSMAHEPLALAAESFDQPQDALRVFGLILLGTDRVAESFELLAAVAIAEDETLNGRKNPQGSSFAGLVDVDLQERRFDAQIDKFLAIDGEPLAEIVDFQLAAP